MCDDQESEDSRRNNSANSAVVERLIDAYCQAWSEPEPGRRERILKTVWADGGTYTDPGVHIAGIADLSGHIGRIVSGRSGAKVVRVGAVESHHGLARFAFRVVRADGSVLREGVDFAEFSRSGKLRRIVGFLDPIASLGRTTAPPRAKQSTVLIGDSGGVSHRDGPCRT